MRNYDPVIGMSLNESLRTVRLLSGVSAEDLAQKTVLTVEQIDKIERGLMNATYTHRDEYIHALGISQEDIEALETSMEISNAGHDMPIVSGIVAFLRWLTKKEYNS